MVVFVVLGLHGRGVVWAGAPTGAASEPLESARAELRAGRHESAIDGFKRILTTGEPTLERRLAALEGLCEAQTRIALAQKRPEVATRAIEACSAALHIESGVARLWRLRGLARLAAGQPEQALINFNHALRLDPADAIALRHRGLVQLGLGRNSEADTDFQRAARLDPDQAWHAFNRGLLAARGGKIAEAVEAWHAFEQARGPAGREWLAFVARRDGGDADARRVVEAMQRGDGTREPPKKEVAPESAKKEPVAEPAKKEVAPASSKKEPVAEPAKKEVAPEPPKKEPVAEPAKKEVAPEPPKKEPVAEPAKKEVAPEPPKKEPVAEPAKKEVAPEPPKKESVAEPLKKEVASVAGKGGGYEFRLGSFQDRGNLESTLRALQGAGLTVREEMVMVGDKRFYRLTAGPFASEEEAKAAQEKATKVPGVRPEAVRAR
ncbi:MAG: SPOR domain-containing protein [Magnetococcales bacterium]|nr:SPOR domain-containing protein [Magnetococcales bacterium]